MSKIQLGVFGSGLTGTTGNSVFEKRSDGTIILRQRITPHNPQTQLQEAARTRMRDARRLYATLTEAEAHAWEDFAQSGAAPSPRAYQSFLALTTKFWQLNPASPPPTSPPTEAFTGDGIIVSAAAVGGAVRFSSALANTNGVVTELLLAPVRNWRGPSEEKAFRHCAFHVFAGDYTDIARTNGKYAAAIRFVRSATGQVSQVVRLGIVEVG